MVLALVVAAPAAAEERREKPDYDGRASEHARDGATEAAVALPRLAFYPLYALSEYVVRRPLGALAMSLEKKLGVGQGGTHVPFSIAPLVLVDRGQNARFGLHVTVGDEPLSLRLRGDVGVRTWSIGVAPSIAIAGDAATGELHGAFSRRPDVIFHGLGPESSPDARRELAVDRGGSGVGFTLRPNGVVTLLTSIDAEHVDLRAPADLATTYTLFSQRLAVTLDGRGPRVGLKTADPRWFRRNGVRIDLDGEHVGLAGGREFVRWGATVRGSLDVTDTGRIVELFGAVRFADPLAGGDIPILEQVALGGDLMRGFVHGRLVDRSAAVVGAEWRWPIWVWLDGFVLGEVGDVFGAHLDGFSTRLLRLSGLAGMRSTSSPYVFELASGVGTEPLGDGARISSVRLLLTLSRPL